jgi:hypothetical protein
MRNPMNSWDKSDTQFNQYWEEREQEMFAHLTCPERPLIGPKDMQRACKLIKAGTDHRKFLRQIMVWWDITIPRCVWQELDTYKVATVRNSCSTMHKLGSRDLEPSDFQDSDVNADVLGEQNAMGAAYREHRAYHAANGQDYEGVALLAHMKRRLPEGFLQMATYSFSYETGLAMYRSRHNHRMPEWSGPGGICETLLRLPYFKEFVEAAMM